jgi:Trypsin-co-occurring domain 1
VAEIVRFTTTEGASVLVEADEDAFGVEQVGRGADGTIQANERLDRALSSARATIASALTALGGLGFEELVLEFGVKLTAEAGALIARSAVEGHLTVTAKWGAQSPQPAQAATDGR